MKQLLLKLFVREDHDKLSPDEKNTFFLDTFRSGVDGISQTLTSSVFLLVAIQHFQVNDFWKSLISASIHFGMILSLFTSVLFRSSKPPRIAGLATIAGGVILILTGINRVPAVYGVLVLFYGLILYIRIPLFTAIYAENYNADRRGRLFSGGVLFSLLTGLLSSFVFGFILNRSIDSFSPVYIFTGILLLISGFMIGRIPFPSGVSLPSLTPLKNLSLLIKNPVFGLISLSWFILGFANLWNIPLRTVYLAESGRGLGLPPMTTLLIVGVIPSLIRFLFNNFWAKCFDRFNFIHIRIVTTLIVSMGTVLFYLTRNLPLIIFAQIIMNIGFSASPFMWNLWVTKVAPPGESRMYMSVHTFLCGIRGVLGPFTGFLFLTKFTMRSVGFVSFGLFMISLAVLIPLVRYPLFQNKVAVE